MNLTTKTSAAKEEENPEYYLAHGSPPEPKTLPKSESRDQLRNSPTVCSESSSSSDGNSSNSFTPSQYNGVLPCPTRQLFDPSSTLPTDSAMFIPPDMKLDASQRKLLLKADRQPPVSKRTLSELDLDRIMRNINLRVDVNFDHGLHFMPVSGAKARDRERSAKRYYDALGVEMSIYAFCAAQGITGDKANHDQSPYSGIPFEPRLPDMLKTLQEVLGTLVPERDHSCVMENLDVSLLMQQIQKGVLDLVALSQWLGALLKTHCAPMRDSIVDKMVTKIRDGCAAQDMYQVAQGLNEMFGALEAMKLDVANHQIRAFHIVLVEDTVRFLQSHFLGRITMNTINAERAKRWYLSIPRHESSSQAPQCQFDTIEPVRTLFRGILSLLVSYDPPKGFPDTFEFDVGRLWRLRADVQDIICLEICYHIFRELAISRNRNVSIHPEAYLGLRTGIWSVLDGCETGVMESRQWQKNTGSIALEIARALSSQEIGTDNNSTVEDGRSRTTNLDQNVLRLVETTLESSFSHRSTRFCHFQARVRLRLETETCHLAKRYLSMSPLEICDAQNHRNYRGAQTADLENVARRLAHIGVLHWKVWAPLLYAREEARALESESAVLPRNNSNRRSAEVQSQNTSSVPSSV